MYIYFHVRHDATHTRKDFRNFRLVLPRLVVPDNNVLIKKFQSSQEH